MSYTTANLLTSIKNRAFFPVGQDTFEDSDLLDIASEIIETDLLPKLMQARQEFFVVYNTLTTTKRTTDTYPWIRIPERAVGQAIICLKDDNDDPVHPTDYWVEGSKIYLDEGAAGNSYRVYFYLRPGKLVETADAGLITAIDTATGIITVTPPSTFTTSKEYDFVRAKAGFDTLSTNLTASAVGATTMTFTAADLPSELAVGDYVCLADQTPIPQIPVEWFGYLGLLTAIQVLEDLGDTDAAAVAQKKLARIEKNCLSLVQPRIEKRSKAIKPPEY
jgi:hypothetical protein